MKNAYVTNFTCAVLDTNDKCLYQLFIRTLNSIVVVEDTVILELKSIEELLPIHEAQLLTYLRLSGKRVGLF